ncbi:hypothetical protein PHISCL_03359 [Aspergillus sclerotialis]|uniref:Uncharacterized protein n=1 Tax=Aspergillus sclerotialis TaxID=2070753 RepID=A0A3A2ZY87_9EURO|nr:hypothetical protein PHISCL_03359 [Aspergillus sclerotialis]
MPRTLPWLTGESRKVKRESTPQKPRIKPELPNNSDDEKKPHPRRKSTKAQPEKLEFFRSSQSPPTSPIHRCPSEEYLHEGLDNDDIYIMVEDEFYSIAQTFTQHLHYAEYVKRQKEVKKLNEATIRDLVRSTDGTPILEETRKRKEAEELSARQKNGLDRLPDEEEGRDVEEEMKQDELEDAEEDADWEGTFLSSTRAAAGFSKQAGYGNSQVDASSPIRSRARDEEQHDLVEETASEDDDLDLQTNLPAPKQQLKRENGTNTSSFIARASPASTYSAIDSESRDLPSMNVRYRSPTGIKPRKKKLFDFDSFDNLPELNKPKFPTQERKSSFPLNQQDSGGDSKSKKARLNEVPTFLL